MGQRAPSCRLVALVALMLFLGGVSCQKGGGGGNKPVKSPPSPSPPAPPPDEGESDACTSTADCLGKMSLAEKIGQMTQVQHGALSRNPLDITTYYIGERPVSALCPRNRLPAPHQHTARADWRANDAFVEGYDAAVVCDNTWLCMGCRLGLAAVCCLRTRSVTNVRSPLYTVATGSLLSGGGGGPNGAGGTATQASAARAPTTAEAGVGGVEAVCGESARCALRLATCSAAVANTRQPASPFAIAVANSPRRLAGPFACNFQRTTHLALLSPTELPTHHTPNVACLSFAQWADMYDNYQSYALQTPLKIPLIYGVDAVHGHNNVEGATVFPHNIGLGATRNTTLVQKIAEATMKEVLATGEDFRACQRVVVAGLPPFQAYLFICLFTLTRGGGASCFQAAALRLAQARAVAVGHIGSGCPATTARASATPQPRSTTLLYPLRDVSPF